MTIHEILVLVITLLVGFIGVPVIQFLKNTFNLADKQAALLTGVVAVVFAGAELFATGQLGIADFTLENFTVVFTSVYGLSQIFYQLLVKNWDEE